MILFWLPYEVALGFWMLEQIAVIIISVVLYRMDTVYGNVPLSTGMKILIIVLEAAVILDLALMHLSIVNVPIVR